jgi:dephospho-CoA kinase
MIVGITGGIGSGKSVVCNIFSILGIPVYNADEAAKEAYDKYPELSERVKEEISPSVVDKAGKINRKALAEIVFSDPEKLMKLNAMVHPLVGYDFENWIETHRGYPYLLKEAAILFESGAYKMCKKIISISSPVELRIARLKVRDKRSRNEIEQIIANQLTDEERNSKSDFVIYNDEKQMIIPQVIRIHEALMKLSPSIVMGS